MDSDQDEQPQKPEAGFYHQYKKQYPKNQSPLVKSNIKTDDSERLLTKRTSSGEEFCSPTFRKRPCLENQFLAPTTPRHMTADIELTQNRELDLSIADFNQKRINGTAQAQINNNRSA